jgi:MFS family permease
MPPARPKFFYGWIIVVAAVAAGAFSSGAGVWGASVFISPMTDELGWSRSAFFGAFTIRAILAGILSPIIGPMQDSRSGPRILMFASGITMGFSLIGLKWVDNLGVFYVLFGALGALSMIGGAEMLTVAIVPKWFVRRRGRAVAIASTGTAMGPLFFPFMVHAIISAVGWRDAWMVMGFIILAILVPLSFLIHSKPEDIGLLPDGDVEPTPKASPASASPPSATPEAEASRAAARPSLKATKEIREGSMTRSEAVRTRSFWLLIAAFTLAMLGMGGFHANWLPYFEDLGFSPSTGAWAASAYGICSISIRLFWGILAERFPVRYLMVAQSLITGVSIILFLNIVNVPTLILAGGFHGIALGGFFIMRPLMVANYFGREHLGAINGILRPFVTASGAMSPLLVAGMFDIYGSYKEAFLLIMITWFAAAAVVYMAKPPRKRLQEQSSTTTPPT